ncbi:hypothetical protein K458DRAFT_85805 [Lentithecium fluviatile CBS 122367]|uniref:CCHC-type domain-containing protein n=1 Tax=Lentithecium fluviatile CBS 122367 TaxID=1168545 RepID=A0A6G1ISY2_9PLEO|nr:hypothetical protein K458DRAFT_85805 [Lentithecium fluviatile CBS 122367]
MPSHRRSYSVDPDTVGARVRSQHQPETGESFLSTRSAISSTMADQVSNNPVSDGAGPANDDQDGASHTASDRANLAQIGDIPPEQGPSEQLMNETRKRLEVLRKWKQQKLDELELEELEQQRARFEAGDRTALLPASQASSADQLVTTSSTSGLPRPKDPHTFIKRDRRDYNLWVADCEGYFVDNPRHFATEAQKAQFGARYISEELKTSWRMEQQRQRSLDPLWDVTWDRLSKKMLESLGSRLERRQRAMESLKGCRQRPTQSPTDLLNYMRPLWEEVGSTDESTQALEFFNCLLEWVRDDLYLQDPDKRSSVRDVEEAANVSWRRHQSKHGKAKANVEGKRQKERPEGGGGMATPPKKPKRGRTRRSPPKRGAKPRTETDRSEVVCFYCKKPGHIRPECEAYKIAHAAEKEGSGKGSGQRR